MGKRRVRWGQKTYLRFLKEGRGQGELAEYKPWITTHDFPSEGTVTRIRGRIINRIYHLLSKLELRCFLYLESLPGIEDIKEQYPLPLEHTQLIAAELGISHPYVNGYPYVMTTDFFYRQAGQWHAVQVKPAARVNDPRVQEKFQIEQAYYRKTGVDWRVMTEHELPEELADNLQWLYAGCQLEQLIPDGELRRELLDIFLELYADVSIDFHTILGETDRLCHFSPGTALQMFKHLVINKQIKLDLSRRINLQDPRVLPYLRV